MAPKAKVAAKAKAKAAAKAKARGAAKVKALARAVAKARARGRGALRRPSGREPEERPAAHHQAAWDGGHTVRGADISLDWLRQVKAVVVEEGKYFHRDCKLAGEISSLEMVDGQVILKISPTGTTDEAILKLQSATPSLQLRVLLCGADCNHEETAEDLIHGLRLRKTRVADAEEPWVKNLEKVVPLEGSDELAALRLRMGGDGDLGRVPQARGESPGGEKKKEKKDKEKEKKKKKDKKEETSRKEKKKRKSVESSQTSSTGEVALDGTKPKSASQKNPKALYRGTGLDPSAKVRAKVMRRAQKYVKRKGRRSSSGSESSSGSSKSPGLEVEQETLFQHAARVREVAEGYPGVLANQALSQMRTHLLQHLGEEDSAKGVPAIALQYYRQVLQRKAVGAAGREVLTLCAVADCLVKGKPAQALDMAMQRIKSAEATMGGVHWSVSQKMEILPPEQAALAGVAEMKEAQRIAQEEQKTRWMSSQPEGRGQTGGKSGGKGKGGGKSEYGRGEGKKGNKGQNQKSDWKKKDEGTGKGA